MNVQYDNDYLNKRNAGETHIQAWSYAEMRLWLRVAVKISHHTWHRHNALGNAIGWASK